jgi:hypothetical protein
MITDISGVSVIDESGVKTSFPCPKKTDIMVFISTKVNELAANGYELTQTIQNSNGAPGRVDYIFEKNN